MFFSFENSNHSNLISCQDKNLGGHPRITSSPYAGFFFYGFFDKEENTYEIISKFLNMTPEEVKKITFNPYSLMHKIITKHVQTVDPTSKEKYIISVCVHHDPEDWAGPPYTAQRHPDRKSLFDYLNPTYLEKLRNKEAIFLIDQTLEGYQKVWLWKWFHRECERLEIPPETIIYTTGNLNANDQYTEWANEQGVHERIKVIPFPNFEIDMRRLAKESGIEKDFDALIEYKKNNPIKTFNCMNKRLRRHRIIFYLYLCRANLLDKGLISMNTFNDVVLAKSPFTRKDLEDSKKLLPLEIYGEDNTSKDDLFYINRIVDRVYKDTWVTVVSEASFYTEDQTIFISEKTFKPIACMHPFIIVGNKGSLKKLRDLGYKTFEGFIDESYDNYDDMARFQAVIETIKKIDAIEDKLKWYLSMREILEHNYDVFMKSRDKIYGKYYTELKEYSDTVFGRN